MYDNYFILFEIVTDSTIWNILNCNNWYNKRQYSVEARYRPCCHLQGAFCASVLRHFSCEYSADVSCSSSCTTPAPSAGQAMYCWSHAKYWHFSLSLSFLILPEIIHLLLSRFAFFFCCITIPCCEIKFSGTEVNYEDTPADLGKDAKRTWMRWNTLCRDFFKGIRWFAIFYSHMLLQM